MTRDSADGSFLPDFCDIRMVFAVVLAGQLLALVLALVAFAGFGEGWWQRLGLLSVFVQWLGLSSAGVLCVARRWLRRLDDVRAGLTSYLLVLLVCAVLSEVAYALIAGRTVPLDPSDWADRAWPVGPVDAASHIEFLLTNLCIAAIVAAVALRYLYVQHQWKSRVESEARARIQALQSRIRPHFLFNSMNTIASLTRSDPELAEQITEDLAELFRESLGDASVPTSLAHELETCRQYLRIEQQRLGDRLKVRWDVDSLPGSASLPRLSLQPLLENAVYHGIEPVPEGGEVTIVGSVDGDIMRIAIGNPRQVSPRLDPARAKSGAKAPRKGNQLAQSNVAERLVAFFGPRAKVDINALPDTYSVVLELPRIAKLP